MPEGNQPNQTNIKDFFFFVNKVVHYDPAPPTNLFAYPALITDYESQV